MERNRRTQPRVIQIMPATGWNAVLADDDGQPWLDPLIGWALVEIDQDNELEGPADVYLMSAVNRSRQAVVGLSAAGDGKGWIETPEGDHGFLGYAAPGAEDDAMWTERAREWAADEQKRRDRKQESKP